MTWVVYAMLALCAAEIGTAGADRPEAATSATLAAQIGVDPRVELIAIVFRLAGNDEYNRCQIPIYNTIIKTHFKACQDHALIKLARSLRQKRGVGFDAPMGLAVRLPALEEFRNGPPRVSTEGLDGRWRAEELRAFLDQLPAFAKDAKFDEFLKLNEKLYRFTAGQAEELMRQAHLEWFDRYFGVQGGARFHFVPGLANGPNCYGVKSADGRDIYCILGVWQRTLLGLPKFDSRMIGTVIHEFGHSYCNPIVEAHQAELRAAGERIFPRVARQMKQQAYSNWRTMMYESLVRVAEARYTAAFQGAEAEKQSIRSNEGRGFTWTGGLSELLKRYESQRERYPTLDAFFPEVVRFFNGL